MRQRFGERSGSDFGIGLPFLVLCQLRALRSRRECLRRLGQRALAVTTAALTTVCSRRPAVCFDMRSPFPARCNGPSCPSRCRGRAFASRGRGGSPRLRRAHRWRRQRLRPQSVARTRTCSRDPKTTPRRGPLVTLRRKSAPRSGMNSADFTVSEPKVPLEGTKGSPEIPMDSGLSRPRGGRYPKSYPKSTPQIRIDRAGPRSSGVALLDRSIRRRKADELGQDQRSHRRRAAAMIEPGKAGK